MPITRIVFLSICICFLCSCVPSQQPSGDSSPTYDREFYQIISYTFGTEEQVLATDNYLRDALVPALKRQGIEKVCVFKQYPN